MKPEHFSGFTRYVAVVLAGLLVSGMVKYGLIEANAVDAETQKLTGYFADLLGTLVTIGLAWWQSQKQEKRVDAALKLEKGSSRADLQRALQPADKGLLSNLLGKPLPPNPNARGFFLGIGLNRVDPAAYGGWAGRLVACHNDVKAMARILVGSRWTAPTVLLDEKATIEAVNLTYRHFAEQAQSGDLVVIAHSRHGGQFRDLDQDEADGEDETLCLYDGQVPDDVHAAWLSRFRPGVRIVLIADTCHSQTVARAAYRGRTKAMPRDVAAHAADLQEARIRELRAANPVHEIRASVVTLAACKDSQVAMDGDANGQFTEGLLRVWHGQETSASYEDLIRRVRRYCADQTPQITVNGPTKHAQAFARQKPFTL